MTVVFQEHELGAWVSKVIPNGNGARNGVKHGDQLASIDGKSAVHVSIDKVAATISRTPKKQTVELTFLRYVGPLKPVRGRIMREGLEVHNSSSNMKQPPRSPKTRPTILEQSSPSRLKAPSTSENSTSPKQNPLTSPSEKTVHNKEGQSNPRSPPKKKSLLKRISFKKKK